MLNFTITNNTNSFSIKVGNNTSPFSRNDLRVSFSSDNDQILNIYDKSVNKTLLWSINVSDDVVDVGGVTVFADAQALFNEIEAIFFLDDGSSPGISLNDGNGTEYDPVNNSVDLGNTLTKTTSIEGDNNSLELGTSGSKLSSISINSVIGDQSYSAGSNNTSIISNPGGNTINSTNGSGTSTIVSNPGANTLTTTNGAQTSSVNVQPTTIEITSHAFSRIIAGSSELEVDANNIEFTAGSASSSGIVYNNINPANYQPQSLVPKEYVDNGNSLIINATPPANNSKIWFNTSDSLMYFYDGTNWLSTQLYETTFNDQGATPNNTFFRVGNTVTGETGIGFHLEFSVKIEGLSFNRQPSSASIGNFWLYSNSGLPNPDQAVVILTFTSSADTRGYINAPTYTDLDEGSYIALRWNGTQTNNNIVSLKYRKKYI